MTLPWERNVPELVRRYADADPAVVAVRDARTGTQLTYSQLWAKSGWMAGDLVANGIGPGDVVAVSLDRSVDLVVAFLGILRAGAAYLPLDLHAPADRLDGILADADVRVVVGPRAPSPTVTALPVPDAPVADPPQRQPAADDPCYVMFTSGSTGRPKGVVVPHRAVVRLVCRPHYCVIAPGDRCANMANAAFDATTFEIWGALAAGATVVVHPSVLDLTIDEWVTTLREERIDTMFLTTSLFHTVARERPDAFASVANLVVGGEQLDIGAVRRVLDARPPRRLVNGYGPTETTTFVAYFDCTPGNLACLDRIPVGFPLQDTALHVLDDELTPVAPGDTGELCVGGPGVALGYLGLPELTAQRFVEPAPGVRLYRTGDLARQLPSGAVELLGRRDRQVKLRGFRIELEEIERAALATGLCDTVVVEKVGDGQTAFLAGFVLASAHAGPDVVDELTAHLAQLLPTYMVPSRWTVLDSLPFGPTGKLDRATLVRSAGQSTAQTGPVDRGPVDLGPVGETLREIWQDVLAVPHVAGDSAFVDLGGNSVTAMQVVNRVADRLAVRVEPADVLLAGSLAELVRQLDVSGAAVS